MSNADRVLLNLNDVQRRAVLHGDGPLVVFAGAGSGKTRIITTRVAYLIERGVPPWEILAVTFTNKAAGEMKARVMDLTPYGGRCQISTFHSACARWLREFARELGYTGDFTIYDEADTLAAIKTILKEFAVDLTEETSPAEFRALFSRLKTMALLPSDESLQNEYSYLLPRGGLTLYRRYQEYLASCNAMDFGDLILNVLLLLRTNPVVTGILQRRFRYVLVDEYQDTNRTQFELIARLAEKHRNLFVVGDDDQSIYSWRGAVPANIIDFDKIYPNAVKVTLEQNYRCSANIVDAANAMIANNEKRVPKRLFTRNKGGDPISYRLENDAETEAWWVAERITAENDRFSPGDVAVFYRTNAQSRLIEDALRREDIPYRIFGTVRFYDRMEVKDLMAYLRLVVNENDDVAVKRIINIPIRGIGNRAVDQLTAAARERGLPLMKSAREMVREKAPRLGAKLEPFVQTVNRLQSELSECPLDEVLGLLLDATGYLEHLSKKFPDQAQDKVDNVYELGTALEEHSQRFEDAGLADWLQAITLSSLEEDDVSGVSMMTLHMAKGLEFRRVYIVGMEDGLLPHRSNLEEQDLLEEERRLFYVGMTRAKEKLDLVGAYRRRMYDGWYSNDPSRFLKELPEECCMLAGDAERFYLGRKEPDSEISATFGDVRYEYEDTFGSPDSDAGGSNLRIGQTVRHPTYGRGTVEGVDASFGVVNVVVRFEEFGLRTVKGHHLQAPS